MIESEAAGNCGWIPFEIEREEPSTPDARRVPAPDAAVPIEKCVAVAVPPVHVGNCSRFAFVNVEPASVQSLAFVSATRAYDVYATSLVVWSPVSHGSDE